MPHRQQKPRVKLVTLDPNVVDAYKYAGTLPAQLEEARLNKDVSRHIDDPAIDDLLNQAALGLIGIIY